MERRRFGGKRWRWILTDQAGESGSGSGFLDHICIRCQGRFSDLQLGRGSSAMECRGCRTWRALDQALGQVRHPAIRMGWCQ